MNKKENLIQNLELKNIIRHLMTTQDVLPPWLFDTNEQMFESVRKKLLLVADFVIKKTLREEDGFELEDVCLTGSSAGYWYHQKSDIDLRLIVRNKNCKDITKDKIFLNKFLSTQTVGFFKNKYNLNYLKHHIDVKLSSLQLDFMGIYSIKNNKWLLRPDKNILNDISVEELIRDYTAYKNKVSSDFQDVLHKYFSAQLGDELDKLYLKNYFNKADKENATVKDYLLFKILSKNGVLKQIGSNSILAYNKAFDFPNK